MVELVIDPDEEIRKVEERRKTYELNKPTKPGIALMRFWEGVKRVSRNRQIFIAIPLSRIKLYSRNPLMGEGTATLYLNIWIGKGAAIHRMVITKNQYSVGMYGGRSLGKSLAEYYGHIDTVRSAQQNDFV